MSFYYIPTIGVVEDQSSFRILDSCRPIIGDMQSLMSISKHLPMSCMSPPSQVDPLCLPSASCKVGTLYDQHPCEKLISLVEQHPKVWDTSSHKPSGLDVGDRSGRSQARVGPVRH
jgi:hypothetical protein